MRNRFPELFLGLLALAVAGVWIAHLVVGAIHDRNHLHDTMTITGSRCSQSTAGRGGASRMLASASFALQRFTGIVAEPAIVQPGAAGVHAGLRPGGLAPTATLTRFSWSLTER